MFKTALAELLLFLFLALYLFQPPLHELYNVRNNAVEIVLNQGIAKAAAYDNGRFTPEIIQEMRLTLQQQFYLPAEDIAFVGTTTLTQRGEYIEGTLTVRSSPRWLFRNLFGQSGDAGQTISRHAAMMSEYVAR